jgi:hypothetical protein
MLVMDEGYFRSFLELIFPPTNQFSRNRWRIARRKLSTDGNISGGCQPSASQFY